MKTETHVEIEKLDEDRLERLREEVNNRREGDGA
jgi:hypothetical protein